MERIEKQGRSFVFKTFLLFLKLAKLLHLFTWLGRAINGALLYQSRLS